MRAILRWVFLVLSMVVAAGAAFGAYQLATYSWNQIVDYRSPYAELDLPAAASGSAVASTTVLVIVDGLSDEASRRMEGLNRLREYGCDLTLAAPQPSLSYPNWTTVLSGAPPYVSGVPTNWFDGPVPVETLIDTAARAGVPFVVVAPEDFGPLYRAQRATASFLRSYPTTAYASTELVDKAIGLIAATKPRLVVIHLPDVDNAGHHFGGGSAEYAETVRKTDVDIARLVEGLQNAGTAFAVVADHGHIRAGGHGGWEPSVVNVPGVFFGEGVPFGGGDASQIDVAPTVAVLAGIPTPRFAQGEAIQAVVGGAGNARLLPSWNQRLAFASAYAKLVTAPTGAIEPGSYAEGTHGDDITQIMKRADADRLAFDRRGRMWLGLAGIGVALLVLIVIAAASWRAFVAAMIGCAVYFGLYNALYFLVHGYRWSLSAFNEETMVQTFFNGRMLEALLSGIVAALAAGFFYPYLREQPKGPRGQHLAGWLTLGPATILSVIALLGAQVAWFIWMWGAEPVWLLPDLKAGFKYDLDLIQATALGVAALLAVVVTYLVGRYHPRVRRIAREDAAMMASRVEPATVGSAHTSAEE